MHNPAERFGLGKLGDDLGGGRKGLGRVGERVLLPLETCLPDGIAPGQRGGRIGVPLRDGASPIGNARGQRVVAVALRGGVKPCLYVGGQGSGGIGQRGRGRFGGEGLARQQVRLGGDAPPTGAAI